MLFLASVQMHDFEINLILEHIKAIEAVKLSKAEHLVILWFRRFPGIIVDVFFFEAFLEGSPSFFFISFLISPSEAFGRQNAALYFIALGGNNASFIYARLSTGTDFKNLDTLLLTGREDHTDKCSHRLCVNTALAQCDQAISGDIQAYAFLLVARVVSNHLHYLFHLSFTVTVKG